MTSQSSRRAAKALLAAAAALLLGQAPAHAGGLSQSFVLFPESEQVFRQLIADPRHIALGASYYRQGGRDVSDVALGHSWGLTHWASKDYRWQWQTNIEAMAYSRFIVGGSVNEFETVDFFANLPVMVKRGMWSFRGMLYHESSHLGDDYIRRTGNTGFRYSVEGLQFHASVDPTTWLRAYAGVRYLFHTVGESGRKVPQYGVELTSRDVNGGTRFPMRLFIAEDLQNPEYNEYNINSNTEAGVLIGYKDVKRFVRVYTGYFTGHSPYGQFFRQKEHYLDIGISFHL